MNLTNINGIPISYGYKIKRPKEQPKINFVETVVSIVEPPPRIDCAGLVIASLKENKIDIKKQEPYYLKYSKKSGKK